MKHFVLPELYNPKNIDRARVELEPFDIREQDQGRGVLTISTSETGTASVVLTKEDRRKIAKLLLADYEDLELPE